MQLTTQAFFRKPSQIVSRDILQEASLAMHYWAKYFKPILAHDSVMKEWSSRARYFFQNIIHWCQDLLFLNYSYAFERSFAPASLIMLDYTLAHTRFYSWARYVLSRAMIFRFHQWLHWGVRKEKNKRFTAESLPLAVKLIRWSILLHSDTTCARSGLYKVPISMQA